MELIQKYWNILVIGGIQCAVPRWEIRIHRIWTGAGYIRCIRRRAAGGRHQHARQDVRLELEGTRRDDRPATDTLQHMQLPDCCCAVPSFFTTLSKKSAACFGSSLVPLSMSSFSNAFAWTQDGLHVEPLPHCNSSHSDGVGRRRYGSCFSGHHGCGAAAAASMACRVVSP